MWREANQKEAEQEMEREQEGQHHAGAPETTVKPLQHPVPRAGDFPSPFTVGFVSLALATQSIPVLD